MEDHPVKETTNIQQYKIEHRRKWEERYYFINIIIENVCYLH